MIKTLKNARDAVRDNIQEASAAFWSDAELNRYINRAKDDLATAISLVNENFFLESDTISVVAGTTKYELDAGFFRLKNIRTTTSGKEEMVWLPAKMNSKAFNDGLNASYSAGLENKMMYDIYHDISNKKNYLYISPIPSGALTLNVDFISVVPDLSGDSDVFAIFDPYVGYIIDKATFYALSKGPSGDFKTPLKEANDKLEKIMTNCGRPQIKDSEFVDGFMED